MCSTLSTRSRTAPPPFWSRENRGGQGSSHGPSTSNPSGGQPFIQVNCGAIPENLFESELFGPSAVHSPAPASRPGRFEPLTAARSFSTDRGAEGRQVKLLRVQERRFERVGGSAASGWMCDWCDTNRDLAAEVKSGGFREACTTG